MDETILPGSAEEMAAYAENLANYFYQRTAMSKVTGKKPMLFAPPPDVPKEALEALLLALGTDAAHEQLRNVATVAGKKDTYYYDQSIMTRQYAELDALLEDKDILATIAAVARKDSQLYPRPTQFSKLRKTPFHFSADEILGAAARMKGEAQYEDIGVVTASNGESAFFSSKHISRGYAESLLEWIEVGEKENP